MDIAVELNNLYQAILENPADDTLRLVLADALEEVKGIGYERYVDWAELIRLQVKRPQRRAYKEMERIEELKHNMRIKYIDTLRGCGDVLVERGMISGFTTSSAMFFGYGNGHEGVKSVCTRMFSAFPIDRVKIRELSPSRGVLYPEEAHTGPTNENIPRSLFDICTELVSGVVRIETSSIDDLPFITFNNCGLYKNPTLSGNVLLNDALVVYGRRSVGLPVDMNVFKNRTSLLRRRTK